MEMLSRQLASEDTIWMARMAFWGLKRVRKESSFGEACFQLLCVILYPLCGDQCAEGFFEIGEICRDGVVLIQNTG